MAKFLENQKSQGMPRGSMPPGLVAYAAKGGGAYSKLGRTSVLEALPALIHFGGYRVGKNHKQKLRVVNISNQSVRVTVLPPQTPFFRLKWSAGKKGLIAPGMAETFTVEFNPTEWR